MEKILYLLAFIAPFTMAEKVVMTNKGPVKGVTVFTGEEASVEAFLGIPYAEPPVGPLRFQRPLPKEPWSGVYDASRLPPSCAQNASNRYFEPNIENMTEDCLFLNMWVPYSKQSTQLKTIMLYIHGGAFNLGSGNMYDGTKMARFGDVILVTINYRLGAFGFLLAYIEEADGNMGIFDQILAVKWVKDNARSFGGDPDNIVLMGESAGAMVIGGHLSSPLTKNLFRRAIMQSGSSLMSLSLNNNTWLFQNSQKLASYAGCADKTMTLKDSPKKVVDCLKRLPAQAIVDAEGVMKQRNPATFLPRMYDDYLPEPSVNLLRKGIFMDTELLIGTNQAEGTLLLSVAAPEYFGDYGVNRVGSITKRLASQITRTMFSLMGVKGNKEIADHYIGNIKNGSVDDYVDAIGDAVGDYFITCCTYFHAEFHSLRNPVYYYVMTRRPSSTPLAEWMKTTHYDELQYVFGNPLFENFTPEEQAFSNRIMARWVAFAKTGNPNIPGLVDWPKFDFKDQKYLELNDEETVHSKPIHNRCEFWRKRHEAVIDDDLISRIKNYSNK